MNEDPLEDLLIKQNWSTKFSEALENKAFWDNTLNRIVRDGHALFGKEVCQIMCADLKNQLVQKLHGAKNNGAAFKAVEEGGGGENVV